MSQIIRRGARHTRLCVAAVLAIAGTLPAVAQIPLDLVPLREAYNSGIQDSFYSIYRKQHQQAVQLGFGDRGVTAWVPCSRPDVRGPHGEPPVITLNDNNLGYGSMADMPMGFGCAQPAGTKPLYRLYKGTPATAHVYTTDAGIFRTLQQLGWGFERVEGYLFATQIPGTEQVNRFSRCSGANGANGDESTCNWEHRLVLGERGRDALMYDHSWRHEGPEGYAFRGDPRLTATVKLDGSFNGVYTSAASPQALQVRDVTAPMHPLELSGSGRNTTKGVVVSNTTQRPAGPASQRMSFQFHTGNLFDAGSNLDHIALPLHFHAQLGSDGLPTAPVDGLGVVIAPSNWAPCGQPAGGGQIFVKFFGNAQSQAISARPYALDCGTRLSQPLAANSWYRVQLTVADNARLHLRVERLDGQVIDDITRDYSTMYPTCPLSPSAQLSSVTAHCGNAMPLLSAPNQRTGYAVLPTFRPAAVSARGMLGLLKVQWLGPTDR